MTLANELDMDAVVAGDSRLSAGRAMHLYQRATLHELGRWASLVCERLHRGRTRTYVIDRNINYTNVCSARCTFCAFKRDLPDSDAYTLSTQQLHQKIAELAEIGGTQILLQGGMHPELDLPFYEQMLRGIKEQFPQVHIHGFSPPEIVEFVAVFKLDGFATTQPGHSHELGEDVWHAKLEAIMRRLMAAGLDSIPGGGGEIFAEPVRRRIGLGKATSKQWLDVMACAHRLGMLTSATMMFGHIEGIKDRIDHMLQIRAAQDRAIAQGWPGRFVSFISWPFQPANTPLGRLEEWDFDADGPFPADVAGHRLAGKRLRFAGATDYLRTQALSRLVLDNIPSIGSSWVTMGPKIGQLGLFYGANDMGSVMMEENVVSAAGTTYCLNEPVLCHLIRSAGFVPAQRDNRYHILCVHDGDSAPDRRVNDWSQHRVQQLERQGVAPGDEGDIAVGLTVGTSTVSSVESAY